jgi:hypothetical protein
MDQQTSTQTAAPGPCGGTVTETWNATDACGRTITAVRTITVTPAAAPTFTSPPANITVACGGVPAVSVLNYSNGSSGTCLINGSATSTQTAARVLVVVLLLKHGTQRMHAEERSLL